MSPRTDTHPLGSTADAIDLSRVHASRGASCIASTPTLPALSSAAAIEDVGVESLAAILTAESAQIQSKWLRQAARDAGAAQLAAIERQTQALRDKAHDVRVEAWVNAATGAIAATAEAFSGKQVAGPITAIGTGFSRAIWGADAVEADADANAAAASAKEHEVNREDFDALARDAKALVDKALAAVAALLQERTSTRHALLRPGG